MENELFFEFIVVIIEITVFMAFLSVGAIIIEVLIPRFMSVLKSITAKINNVKVVNGISLKAQGG